MFKRYFEDTPPSAFVCVWKANVRIGRGQGTASNRAAQASSTATPFVEGPEEEEEEEKEKEKDHEEMVLNEDLMGEEAWTRALEVVNAADPYKNGNLFIMEPSSEDDQENSHNIHDGYEAIGDDGVEI
ncbi:hypothetical protein BC939DRAFT_475139 [Gamsiella multidivaricata]|uniref:uncharacterized protein n=1 Tax=Gamsiella multidivaricata TaxID=101098 RepID=UPI0022205124|nr:uncharacterized protein BC939DRAFT_475139 [Gamsiella multidivaricata]KAI7827536.1 hypothetical protein BC939DRAFT_475139 [Gamsiella multidivaricata]